MGGTEKGTSPQRGTQFSDSKTIRRNSTAQNKQPTIAANAHYRLPNERSRVQGLNWKTQSRTHPQQWSWGQSEAKCTQKKQTQSQKGKRTQKFQGNFSRLPHLNSRSQIRNKPA